MTSCSFAIFGKSAPLTKESVMRAVEAIDVTLSMHCSHFDLNDLIKSALQRREGRGDLDKAVLLCLQASLHTIF
jgi:hypothetical protein